MYDILLFDLDGTLTDSSEGITNSVAYALSKWGITVEDPRSLTAFVGPPLTESFEKYYGIVGEDNWRAVTYYREYFEKQGMYENTVYDGIRELLAELKEGPAKVIVTTSKPETYSREILDYFDLTRYFDDIFGANMDGTRLKKKELIRDVLGRWDPDRRHRPVMIGDREHDILGAKAMQIDSIGVLYGFGSREELETAGATHIIDSVSSLRAYLGDDGSAVR